MQRRCRFWRCCLRLALPAARPSGQLAAASAAAVVAVVPCGAWSGARGASVGVSPGAASRFCGAATMEVSLASCLSCFAPVCLSGFSAGLFVCALLRFAACSFARSFAAAFVCLAVALRLLVCLFLHRGCGVACLFARLAVAGLSAHSCREKNEVFRLLSIGASGSSLLARVRGDAALSVRSLARRRRLLVCLHKCAAKN